MALEAAGLEADESLLNGESEPVAKQPGDTLLSGSSVIAEQVRADAADTLRYFMEQGIALRVISGGHPQTVAAIARQVGVPGADEPVDAHHSAWKDRLAPLVKDRSAFGRASPCDKQQMAAALQAKGRVVAMVGGGVLLGVGAAMVYPALLAAGLPPPVSTGYGGIPSTPSAHSCPGSSPTCSGSARPCGWSPPSRSSPVWPQPSGCGRPAIQWRHEEVRDASKVQQAGRIPLGKHLPGQSWR